MMPPGIRAWSWLLSGVLTALSIPNRSLHIPGLALVCLVPFFVSHFYHSPKDKPQLPLWQQALLLWLVAGSWVFIPDVLGVRAILAPWEIVGGLVVAPLVPLYFVAATVLSLRLGATLPWRPLAIAIIWTAWDSVWGLLQLPLPLHFGASVYDLPLLIQIADLTGIYGVTFTVILANATVASFFCPATISRRHRCAGLALLAAILLYDGFQSLPDRTASNPIFTVGAIQPLNWLEPDRSWEARRHNYDNLQALSLRAIDQGADLVIWPEGAARAQLTQFGLKDYLLNPLTTRLNPDQGLLAGSSEPLTADTFLNAALLFNGNGSLIGRYGKQWVFPIFETGRGIAADTAGYIPLPGGVRLGALGTMICLESVLPQAARALTEAGAESLMVISEDIWFGDSNWPLLHGVLSVFRAVENRRDFVFVNNTGGNLVVDAQGRIRAWGDYWQPDAVVATLERRTGTTFYTRYGDVFAIATLTLTTLLLLRAMLLSRQSCQTRQ